jgi:hypothetical protein
MSDAELATVEDFLVAYEREGSDADREWRWMSIAPEVCLALLKRGFAPQSLLLNKKLPVNVLQVLAAHPDPHIRSLVADKRAAGPVLRTLASDPDLGVRLRVVWNAKIPADLLRSMLDDPAPEVRENARSRMAQLDTRG